MPLDWPEPNTCVCADTPHNRAVFDRLKASLLSGKRKPRITSKATAAKQLAAIISAENKSLGKLRSFLPGHEPDRCSL